jgi:hypothetical protein
MYIIMSNKLGVQINEDTSWMACDSKEVLTNGSKHVGFNNCQSGFNVYDRKMRCAYGSNHYNQKFQKLAMEYEQRGNFKLPTQSQEDKMFPANLRFKFSKPILRDGIPNKALLENISRSALENGRGQIYGFEIPEKNIVSFLDKEEKQLDSDKFGDKKAGFGQAGFSEINLLEQAVKSERRTDKEAIKSEEKNRDLKENSIPTVKQDINEIKNF